MANSTAVQVVTIDTVGDAISGTVKISGIQILPTGATWVVKLTDTAGNTIISLDNNSPTPVLTQKTFTGISAATLTNITEVLIWIN